MTRVPPVESGDDPRVDELRRQLRALGYLDAGVDRFVLGPASDARRPVTIAALAALRVGLLAGALLGPAVALGIGNRLPTLVTGARDALVIAVYLAVLFGVAAAIVTFVTALLVAKIPVAALGRHARLVSRAAGTVVGGGCLVYLTLWWRITSVDAASIAPLWTAGALAVAVMISLLLGHAIAITTFAVLVAGGGTPVTGTRAASTWRLTAAAAVVAFIGAGALLVFATPDASPPVTAPPLAVVSPGLRVRVLALDGFDGEIARALASRGEIPALARILGGSVARIAPDDTHDPARAWTTIATGQPVDVHGVRGLETTRVAGIEGSVNTTGPGSLGRALRGATDALRLTTPSTASGAHLRAKTFWEVAADAGLRAAVLNWWATWPAASGRATDAIVLSDRATLRLEHGGELDAEIAPAELYEQLRRDWAGIKREAGARVAALPQSTDPALRRAAEVDALQIAIADRLDKASLDLLAVYLPGLDIAQQTLFAGKSPAAPDLSARLEALRPYYVFLDRLLQEVATPGADELLVVIMQPGRVSSPAPGIVALLGEGAAVPGKLEGRTVDLAPTILYALGIPISRELAGAPMVGVFSDELRQRFPVRRVETYGERTLPRARRGQPLDQEMIERLRSLGYVR